MKYFLLSIAVLALAYGVSTIITLYDQWRFQEAQASLGVTFDSNSNGFFPSPLPPPIRPSAPVIAAAVRNLNFGAARLRLHDATPDLLQEFEKSGVSVLVSLPNELLAKLAGNSSAAVVEILGPILSSAAVSTISVGEEPKAAESQVLMEAVKNVQEATRLLKVESAISVTVSFGDVIDPPPFLGPLLRFLNHSGSPLLVKLDVYEYYKTYAYPLPFALSQPQGNHTFSASDPLAKRYNSLFDLMLSGVVEVLNKSGYHTLPVAVAETRWPSSGDSSHPEANGHNAAMFWKGIVEGVVGRRTPVKLSTFAVDPQPGGLGWGIITRGFSKIYTNEDPQLFVLFVWAVGKFSLRLFRFFLRLFKILLQIRAAIEPGHP
ncbi:unnamed protein product [Linum trigynum]|uniref:glucan endo-1,3-beta-D-glucosidase n=1 Tax=Linum trigynum TaxID=586398 RepID=A0AAV2CLH9_9ROSI